MLELPETSPLEKNLRFVKNEVDDQLQEMFLESKEQSRAPFKMVKPYPGLCIKSFKIGSAKDKFFINVCHTSEIPAPKDITESELHKLIEEQNASDFKVPLSVTKPRKGKDKSGSTVDISDVAVNSEFYAKKIKRADGLFYHFLITLVFESLEQKYKTEIDTTNFIVLKNRACIDQLVEHQIYNRDIKTVENFHAQSELIGGSEGDDQIVLSSNQKKTKGKLLIEEISPNQHFKPRKSISIPNVTEPEHRLIYENDEVLIAEFYMPLVRNSEEISVEANDDRIVVNSQKHDYLFDGFLPNKINEKKTVSEFDNDRMILTVRMSV